MKKIVSLTTLAILAVICFLPVGLQASEKGDAEIRAKLIGFWRSPRHDYEIKANGIIYMLPAPAVTKSDWKVKDGFFYWDGDRCAIVSLTDKKFVYKSVSGQANSNPYVLIRITKKMVGGHYDRSSIQ